MVSHYVVAIAAAAAAGIIAWVVVFGDIPYRMQDGKEITVTGQMVCLPHKIGIFGGAQTDECLFGFRDQNGEHYAINNFEEISRKEPLLAESVGSDRKFVITGIFTYGDYGNYDVVGVIDVSVAADFDSIRTGTS